MTGGLIAAGVLAAVGSIGVIVLDAPALVRLRVRVAYPFALPPIPAAARLDETLSIRWESGTFHAASAGHLRPGTILFMVCENTDPMRQIRGLRVRADALFCLGTTVAAHGFTPGFLNWETGEAVQDLAPSTAMRLPVVRHDVEWAVFTQVLPQTTQIPVSLADGRWAAEFTITAADLGPMLASCSFSCERESSPITPGRLEFLAG